MSEEKNQKIELSANQRDPYLAKAEDFVVRKAEETLPVCFDGSHGDNRREEQRLLHECDSLRNHSDNDRGPNVDHAGKAHSP